MAFSIFLRLFWNWFNFSLRRERNPGPEENYGPEIKSNHDGNILFKDGIGEKCKSETTLRVNSDKEGLERKENTSSDQGPVKNIYRSSELENGEERRNPVQLYSEYPCEHIQHDPNLTPDLSQAVTRRRRRIPTLLILSFIKLIDLSFHGIMLSLFLYSTYLSAIYCTQVTLCRLGRRHLWLKSRNTECT